ncbi:MAG: DUF4838 domain-containing protein [Limisphaerales bacterium]
MQSPIPRPHSRRQFLKALSAGITGAAAVAMGNGTEGQPFFQTRGVVLVPGDLTFADWPERAHEAGLTTIGLHHGVSPRLVAGFIQSEGGQKFLEKCHRLGLQVEYELHAMRELLPRELFAKDAGLFRMNEHGERTADANLCIHSNRALEIAAENAVALARVLRPTTGRYFFWGDDGQPWCRCPRCAGVCDSDQALALENSLLRALRREQPRAQLAHLAYSNTLAPPKQVRPISGIFLEFAPIEMRNEHRLTGYHDPQNRRYLDLIETNLAVFGSRNAQALEYWLDDSMYSHWRRPAQPLPFNEQTFAADLDVYGKCGVRHLTSFAVFIDADYVSRFGFPPEVRTYGDRLRQWRRA